MQEVTGVYIFCFSLFSLTSMVILVFYLRKRDKGIDYNKYFELMNRQTEKNLSILSNGNKEIDKIEEKIRICKKKLGIKLVTRKK